MPGIIENIRGRTSRIRDRLFLTSDSSEAPLLRDGELQPDSADRDLDEVADKFERIKESAASAEERDAASRFWQSLREGKSPERIDLNAVEAIVERYDRPVFFVSNDDVDVTNLPGRWEGINDPANQLRTLIRATGRIDADGLPADYAGTGVYVGKGLLATNRHVALLLCNRIVRSSTKLDRKAWVNFTCERTRFGVNVPIESALLIHPYWDFALLRCGIPDQVDALSLSAVASSANGVNRVPTVVVIGFPALSGEYPFLENRIFQGEYGIKRVQPGYERGPRVYETNAVSPLGSKYRKVTAGTHDSSTLGGNSGSGLFEVGRRTVRGFHFAGRAFDRNYFVPSFELALDPRVRTLGVNFDDELVRPTNPLVEDEWGRYFGPESIIMPIGPKPIDQPRLEATIAGDWIEVLASREQSALAERSPNQYRSEIADSLGAEVARIVADRMTPSWDPELPEIILVPGWMGSHLLDISGNKVRRWLSTETFREEYLATDLHLGADGASDADGHRIIADGVVQWMYLAAATAWRASGFLVHEFAYDWRRSVVASADRLQRYIADRTAERPGARFALVAHSFGGLVACAWATRHPGLVDRVQRAVLVGVPLGGAMTAVECALGRNAFARKLELATAAAARDHSGALGRSRGALDALPDTTLYPEAAALYRSATWPDPPPRAALDDSLALKHTVRQSPLLDKATAIVSSSWGTAATHRGAGPTLALGAKTVPGDGVVTVHSALSRLMPAWESSASHWELLRDPKVVEAVALLLTSGEVDMLKPIAQPTGPIGALPPPDDSVAEGAEGDADYRAVGVALGSAFTSESLAWLFTPGVSRPSR